MCPVVSALREHTDVALSVDTTRAEVADAALQVGVNAINDVSAAPKIRACLILRRKKDAVWLMHRARATG